METKKNEFILNYLSYLNEIIVCKKNDFVEITIPKDSEFNRRYYVGDNFKNPKCAPFINLNKNSNNQFTITLFKDAYEIVLEKLSSKRCEGEEVKLILPPIDDITEEPRTISYQKNTHGICSFFSCCFNPQPKPNGRNKNNTI